MFERITDIRNLILAWRNARKGKTKKKYVKEFEKNTIGNLFQLKRELESGTYKPRPLETFILRDPKTRKISKSDFRDRIVHHALINVIGEVFEKNFIYESCANQIGKGNLFGINRFYKFMRKLTKNNTNRCYVLKADIKHYFDEVNHEILIEIIRRKIKDEEVIRLINKVLANLPGGGGEAKRVCPLATSPHNFLLMFIYMN